MLGRPARATTCKQVPNASVAVTALAQRWLRSQPPVSMWTRSMVMPRTANQLWPRLKRVADDAVRSSWIP